MCTSTWRVRWKRAAPGGARCRGCRWRRPTPWPSGSGRPRRHWLEEQRTAERGAYRRLLDALGDGRPARLERRVQDELVAEPGGRFLAFQVDAHPHLAIGDAQVGERHPGGDG